MIYSWLFEQLKFIEYELSWSHKKNGLNIKCYETKLLFKNVRLFWCFIKWKKEEFNTFEAYLEPCKLTASKRWRAFTSYQSFMHSY